MATADLQPITGEEVASGPNMAHRQNPRHRTLCKLAQINSCKQIRIKYGKRLYNLEKYTYPAGAHKKGRYEDDERSKLKYENTKTLK